MNSMCFKKRPPNFMLKFSTLILTEEEKEVKKYKYTCISNKCIAVRKVATPLQELTCHMGSRSVTCHPAEATFPPLPPAEAGTRLGDPGGMQG